jgi:transposase
VLVGAGQANDSPVFPTLLQHLRVDRCGPGRARTTPDAVIGDKAYSARAHRALLRARGIKTVIPEPSDQIRHRKRRGSRGGRPPAFDAETYRGRNVVERSFNTVKQWRGLATRYDKLAIVYRRLDGSPCPCGGGQNCPQPESESAVMAALPLGLLIGVLSFRRGAIRWSRGFVETPVSDFRLEGADSHSSGGSNSANGTRPISP